LKQQKLEAGEHMTPALRSLFAADGLGEPAKMTTPVYRRLMDLHEGFSPLGLGTLVATLEEPLRDAALLSELGDREFYPVDDVDALLRGRPLAAGGRLTKRAIVDAADRHEGFSADRMLLLLRERIRYLLDRGATRNNPHIPESTLLRLVPEDQVIAADAPRPAQTLERLVLRER
jgi:hypothetical protein